MITFTLLGQSTSILELFAMLTGLFGVWLTIRQNVFCFPVGIINVALYAWLFYTPGIQLYADALLQVFYLVLLAYGWSQWSKRKNGSAFIATRSSALFLIRVALLTLITWIIFGFLFQHYTSASLPWIDSLLTSMSLAAQYMIAKKKIENWFAWIAADAAYVPMYFYKHLPLTGILYLIFLLMAIRGWKEWNDERAIKQAAV